MTTDTPVTLDAEWLKGVLVKLLNEAQLQTPTDHQACAKYADLLYKMLPKGKSTADTAVVDMVRKAVIEGKL